MRRRDRGLGRLAAGESEHNPLGFVFKMMWEMLGDTRQALQIAKRLLTLRSIGTAYYKMIGRVTVMSVTTVSGFWGFTV